MEHIGILISSIHSVIVLLCSCFATLAQHPLYFDELSQSRVKVVSVTDARRRYSIGQLWRNCLSLLLQGRDSRASCRMPRIQIVFEQEPDAIHASARTTEDWLLWPWRDVDSSNGDRCLLLLLGQFIHSHRRPVPKNRMCPRQFLLL